MTIKDIEDTPSKKKDQNKTFKDGKISEKKNTLDGINSTSFHFKMWA